jgi:hypothetical protein
MGEVAPKVSVSAVGSPGASGRARSALREARPLALLLAAYVASTVFRFALYRMGLRWALRGFADQMFSEFIDVIGPSYVAALFVATLVVPLGLLARSLARGRVRASLPDPLAGARAWTSAHPNVTTALLALPALSWSALLLAHRADFNWFAIDAAWMLVAGLSQFALARGALRALVAPTLAEGEEVASEQGVEERELVFEAVAVTRETRAAVAAMAALPIAVVAIGLLASPSNHVMAWVIAGYLSVAAAGTLAFRRASRIAIGVDGVLVSGSSRTRFFAYRDVDDARARGANLELYRGGSVVLRLQLHGKDAARRSAVLARLRDAISAARERRGVGAEILLDAASRGDGAERSTIGRGDYRQPSPSREQLWEVVEGGAANAKARTAAASALATSLDAGDRARLRVVAAQCAEPRLRVALESFVSGDDAHEPDDVEGDAPLERRAAQDRP